MSPRQARIVLGSFMLLAAGVAVNALFLQHRAMLGASAVVGHGGTRSTAADRTRQPAKAPAIKTSVSGELRLARFKPDSAMVDDSLETVAEADAETIRAIQRELRQRGFGALTADGQAGLVTRAAIMAYEADNGLAVTGAATEQLLRRLLLGAAALEPLSDAKVRPLHAERVIKAVQQALTTHGYQPGRIDGRLGDDTIRAIREFETDKGLIPRGRITADIVARLVEGPAGASKAAR
jgi:peptidoglycan hydrolase-like protein with peptidoglycan-binding domain